MTMIVLLLSLASAAEVVVFGDSWAEGGGDELQDALRGAGLSYDVHNAGVSGTTATYWNSSAPTALADAVTLNPDAKWVWLSILGNDTFGYHAAGQGPTAAASNEAQLHQLLAGLHAAHPDVQVVGIPYDYVNFEQSTECIVSGALYFPDLLAAGTFSSYSINRIFEAEVGEVLARVDADDVRYSTYPMWGTLQADAGTVGAPNVLLPSPESRMSDCIHPTSHGYRVLLDKMVARYWGHAAPVAMVQGLPSGPVCEGSALALSESSTHTDAVEWTVDGAAVSTASAWTSEPLEAGALALRLRAYGGAWHDDVEAWIEVVPPPAIEVSDDVTICAGESAVLHSTGGSSGSWSPADGLTTPGTWDTTASPLVTTTYTATVSSGVDCASSAEVTVTVLDAPVFTLSGPDTVVAGEPASFLAAFDGPGQVAWAVEGGATVDASDGAALLTWSTEGTFVVTAAVTNFEGCTSVQAQTVTVLPAATGDTAAPGGFATDDVGYRPCGCGASPAGAPSAGWLVLLAVAGRRRRSPVWRRRSAR